MRERYESSNPDALQKLREARRKLEGKPAEPQQEVEFTQGQRPWLHEAEEAPISEEELDTMIEDTDDELADLVAESDPDYHLAFSQFLNDLPEDEPLEINISNETK